MQAEVKGQLVTWLTPHPLQQVLTEDVDFNIMLNFLEFYEVTCFIVIFLFLFFSTFSRAILNPSFFHLLYHS